MSRKCLGKCLFSLLPRQPVIVEPVVPPLGTAHQLGLRVAAHFIFGSSVDVTDQQNVGDHDFLGRRAQQNRRPLWVRCTATRRHRHLSRSTRRSTYPALSVVQKDRYSPRRLPLRARHSLTVYSSRAVVFPSRVVVRARHSPFKDRRFALRACHKFR